MKIVECLLKHPLITIAVLLVLLLAAVPIIGLAMKAATAATVLVVKWAILVIALCVILSAAMVKSIGGK